jgi:DNA primase small subunit
VTKESLKNDLVSKLPVKIDIGAVYNAPPNMHASIPNFAPQHKELVFDIDMTDYDDIRNCCSGAAVCDKCWVLMSAAIKVIDATLTLDFGFKHILWVFSGRRGVHWSGCATRTINAGDPYEAVCKLTWDAALVSCSWVCDTRARKLSHDQRAGIVDFLSVYAGKEKKVILTWDIHPSLQSAIMHTLQHAVYHRCNHCSSVAAGTAFLFVSSRRAYDQLLPYFEEMVDSQGWFDTREQTDKIFETYFGFSASSTSDQLRSELAHFQFEDDEAPGSIKWNELQEKVKQYNFKNARKKGGFPQTVRNVLHRIVFGHVYPRLDVNVSKHLNHLLKSPFWSDSSSSSRPAPHETRSTTNAQHTHSCV